MVYLDALQDQLGFKTNKATTSLISKNFKIPLPSLYSIWLSILFWYIVTHYQQNSMKLYQNNLLSKFTKLRNNKYLAYHTNTQISLGQKDRARKGWIAQENNHFNPFF